MNVRISENYYLYLLKRANLSLKRRKTYTYLLQELFETDFTWTVERDKNRASDGKDLRIEYEEDTGMVVDISANCSMLEMLVALAIRCENDIMAIPDQDRTEEWFWCFLENAGLTFFDNEHFDKKQVQKTLDRIIFRRYTPYGIGGLFPLTKPKIDQRRVEIWYQMNSWLGENFSA